MLVSFKLTESISLVERFAHKLLDFLCSCLRIATRASWSPRMTTKCCYRCRGQRPYPPKKDWAFSCWWLFDSVHNDVFWIYISFYLILAHDIFMHAFLALLLMFRTVKRLNFPMKLQYLYGVTENRLPPKASGLHWNEPSLSTLFKILQKIWC